MPSWRCGDDVQIPNVNSSTTSAGFMLNKPKPVPYQSTLGRRQVAEEIDGLLNSTTLPDDPGYGNELTCQIRYARYTHITTRHKDAKSVEAARKANPTEHQQKEAQVAAIAQNRNGKAAGWW
jgi:hypothetical protein